MTSHYSVIQFVPDPLIDEKMNIGVIAYSGDIVQSRFISNWSRARGFSGQDVGFLRDFANEVSRAGEGRVIIGLKDGARLNESELKSIAGRWVNSIQFTPPRASLKDPHTLVLELSNLFLRSSTKPPYIPKSKRSAVSFAYGIIGEALDSVGQNPEKLVHRSYELEGRIQKHKFDIGIANGKPMLAVNAISFEIADERKLRTEVDAMAWAVEDVSRVMRKLPMAMLVYPPKGHSEIYEQTISTFAKLGARSFDRDQFPAWMTEQAQIIGAKHSNQNH